MKYNVFMRKARILLILGVCMAILPYLGFSYSWKDILFTVSGLVLIFFSYLLYKDYKELEAPSEPFDNFRENSNFNETEI
jgi:hypothetical protein